MNAEHIWKEFRKGCVDTQVKGVEPESCEACLEGAIRALAEVGVTNRDAAMMVLKAKSFNHNQDNYHVFNRSDFC